MEPLTRSFLRHALRDLVRDAEKLIEQRMVTCSNCGAEITVGDNASTTEAEEAALLVSAVAVVEGIVEEASP